MNQRLNYVYQGGFWKVSSSLKEEVLFSPIGKRWVLLHDQIILPLSIVLQFLEKHGNLLATH